MINFIKKCAPYIMLLGFIGMLGILFGMSGFSLVKYNSTYDCYVFDIRGYFQNIIFGFNNFKQNISNFYALTLDFSDFIKGLKSICNCIICVLNTIILPFAILANVLNCLLSLIGLPLNNSNFLFNMFNGIGSLQIPYLDY